ncbi:MAG: hypothetical protein U1E23_15510 [Reyranellaceae bacterium]
MNSRRRPRWPLVVLVNLLGIAAVLLAAEATTRWRLAGSAGQGDDRLPMCRPDDTTIWRYRPDVTLDYRTPEFTMPVATNKDGLRSGPPPVAGQPVVLFIGDSFTFGWGVAPAQRFSELAAAAAGAPQFINAGHWMYTFDQQLVLLKELVRRWRPSVVVQGLYWPHVRTLLGHRLEHDSAGRLQAVRAPGLVVDAQGVLRHRSDWVDSPPLGSQLLAQAARALLNRDLQRQAASWVEYMQPGRDKDGDLWAETDALLGETLAFLRAEGVVWVPFLIPTSVEVGGDGWRHVGWFAAEPPSGVDVTLPARRLQAMLERRGQPVLALAEPLRAAGGARLYFAEDGHWNAAGHDAVAALLAPAIARALPPTSR